MAQRPSPDKIRTLRAAKSKMRERDFAASIGISEAELIAAHLGPDIQAITPDPDILMPAISSLGEVMALTRNESAVHERVGTYGEYRSGTHASMVVGEAIDLRIFPKHWVHGFAISQETDKGLRRTLQVFDAAGDAVHKVFMRESSNHAVWDEVVKTLAVAGSQTLDVETRRAPEPAKQNPEKRDALLHEWGRMTDTHQFMRLTAKLGTNRLGAYQMLAGERWVRPLATTAITDLLHKASADKQEVVIFVGNRGMIQIHWGAVDSIKPMGPWINVLDPEFDLHLRQDHVAEAYAILKPTKRGPALSVEVFDADGMLIAQVFGRRKKDGDTLENWQQLVADLPSLEG